MSQSVTDISATVSAPTQPAIRPLRIWPAVILLVLLGVARFCFYLTEEPSMLQFMLAMFGPMVVAAAMPIWWAFASRGTRGERWLGLLAILGIGGATFFLAHDTMRSMWFTFFALPTGLAGEGAVCLRGLGGTRLGLDRLCSRCRAAGERHCRPHRGKQENPRERDEERSPTCLTSLFHGPPSVRCPLVVNHAASPARQIR